MKPSPRLACSTISLQHLPLADALAEIVRLGFEHIDLGALPGVCDHVPEDLDDDEVEAIAATIASSGVRVRSVNGDIGDLNDPHPDRAARDHHLDRLLALTARIGAPALVLPCGALQQGPISSLDEDLDRVAAELARAADRAAAHGVAVWVESLHHLRLCWSRERAEALHSRLRDADVRPVLDLAHVVAAGDDLADVIASWGDRIAHVHVRDASAGDFNRPFLTGDVDFAAAVAALDAAGYGGLYALELPSAAYSADATGALDDAAQREKAALIARAADHVSPLLTSGPPSSTIPSKEHP